MEWRANRLADAVAKRTAKLMAVPRTYTNTLGLAAEVLRTEAVALGAATYAANHCHRAVAGPSGVETQVIVRDAVTVPARPADAPKRPWRTREPPPLAVPRAVPLPPSPCDLGDVPLSRERAPTSAAAAARREGARVKAAFESLCLCNAVTARAAGARPSSNDPAARFDALRDRVRAREAAVAATSAVAPSGS